MQTTFDGVTRISRETEPFDARKQRSRVFLWDQRQPPMPAGPNRSPSETLRHFLEPTINLAAQSQDLNPYATPVTVSDTSLIHGPHVRAPLLRGVIGLQAIVIITSLAVEAYSHESITGSGPIFSLVGLVIAVLAFRNRDRAAVFFGVSAILFAALVVFLIHYNSWGPPQGDRPITILSYAYSAFALPITVWLAFQRRGLAVTQPLHPSGEVRRLQVGDLSSPPVDR